MTNERKPARTVTGVVTSAAMNKTISVDTVRKIQHPLYGKTLTKHKVYKAHDENNEARVGALVKIAAARPLSKTKRWRLIEILKQGDEE